MCLFGEVYPVKFNANITRKMHCLSVVLPDYIRNNKFLLKAQKKEQAGERLHKQCNDLECHFRNQLNLPRKSFLKIRQFERCQTTKKLCSPKFTRNKK